MNEVDKNLSEILEAEVVGEVEEIKPETVSTEIVPAEEHLPATIDHSRDLEYDYEVSRETHRGLLEQGQEALDGILKVAKESQHPRAYEVAAGLLKNLSDMTDKLILLHKHKKDLEGDRGSGDDSPQVNVEKAVFVGSTADLLKQIKNQ